jgi:NifU-like protein
MWEYTDAVRDHFFEPRNAGELPDANAIGEVGSLVCGDSLRLYLKIDKNDVIADVRFQTFGCASAIASSSVLTELIKGKTVDEAAKITNRDIVEKLGGLPEEKVHCSVMCQEALEAAIANWRGQPAPDRIMCACSGVPGEQAVHATREIKPATTEDVASRTRAHGACCGCRQDIQRLPDAEPGGNP